VTPDCNTARRPGTPVRPAPLVLGAVAVLVSLAVAIVLYRAFGDSPDIGYGVRGYTVSSDRQVQVVFEVAKDPASTVLCTVRARDRSGDEVGNSLVRVGPAAQRSTIITYDLATSGRAATGEVTGCVRQGA
jgi:hypothetical protein